MKLLLNIIIFLIIFALMPFQLFSKSFIRNSLENEEIKKALERCLTVERALIERGLYNASFYIPIIKETFIRENLPIDLIYLPLIESAFSPKAFSRAGASGLWQFMPSTARYYKLKIDFWVDERRDPFKSTEKAAYLLKDLYKYYKNWELTLAAYNAGMGSVNRAIKQGSSRNYWDLCSMKLLKRETREYVPRFLVVLQIVKNPVNYGFTVDSLHHFPEFEVLNASKPVDLTILAKEIDVRVSELLFLNPELKLVITPVGTSYSLRVPKQKYPEVIAAYNKLPKEELTGLIWYRVRTGETIGEIAQRYNTRILLIKQINNIRDQRRIYAGQKILIPWNSQDAFFNESVFEIPKKSFSTQEIQYAVRKGDTIWDIAQRFRTDVETILAINGLSFESIIMPGDKIKLWVEIALQR